MPISKVTFKGQVTIPKQVRRALELEPGDSLLFQVEDGQVILKRVKQASLRDLYGAFPARRPFPGTEAIRSKVEKRIAEHVKRIPG